MENYKTKIVVDFDMEVPKWVSKEEFIEEALCYVYQALLDFDKKVECPMNWKVEIQ